MASTITLSQRVYDLVAEEARQAHRSTDAMAEDLLWRTLSPEVDQWRLDFEALISRIQHHTRQFISSEIEADITAAAQDVKEIRRARHRGH